jgi:hypothetical protein
MLPSTIARRAATSVAVATIAVGAAAAPAHAQDFVLPSCPGFDVGVTIESGAGNPIQVGPRAVLAAGTFTFTLENMETGATYSVRTAGAGRATPRPDGSTIFTSTGPNLLFLFPTDPGGPSTTLYLGRLVGSQSADDVTTIISSTGGTVDVCAALGG